MVLAHALHSASKCKFEREQDGEEAVQPLLGVGSGVEVDANDPKLRGGLGRDLTPRKQ